MDYQGCKHPFPILYRPLPEGIRGYFSYDVTCAVNVGIDVLSVGRSVQPTLHTLTAKGVLRVIVWVADRERVTVKETGL